MQPNPAAIERPASFDARVLSYMPALKKLAYRFERNRQDREDLINETVEVALRRWAGYRPDGGFYGWLVGQMRSVVADVRRRARRHYAEPLDAAYIHNSGDDTPMAVSSWHEPMLPAEQDNVIELDQIRAAMRPGRAADMLMRVAAGEEYSSIAADYGVSRQRAHQIVTAERARLRKALNTVRISEERAADGRRAA